MRRLALVGLLSACGGAGAFGFSPEYEPLGAEEDAVEGTTEVGYEDVRRRPGDYAANTIAWFGMVTAVRPGEFDLTFRTLAPRNLCFDETDSSCRVTVSERAGGPFTVRMAIRPEDQDGRDRLWQGSLVRVVGVPQAELSEEGAVVIDGRYYRHWPRGAFVTTAARGSMRR
ncbi:MAG: hypothetical protein AAF411_22615 [Myxococcota bacterium]